MKGHDNQSKKEINVQVFNKHFLNNSEVTKQGKEIQLYRAFVCAVCSRKYDDDNDNFLWYTLLFLVELSMG